MQRLDGLSYKELLLICPEMLHNHATEDRCMDQLIDIMGGETLTRLGTGEVLRMIARETRPGLNIVSRIFDELFPLLEDPTVLIENVIHFFNEGHTNEIDFVLQRLSEVATEDRKLVMSIVGALGDFVALLNATSLRSQMQIAAIKSQIFSLCMASLQSVDESDIPTVVRTLLLSLNTANSSAVLNALRDATQKFTVASMIPVLPALYNGIRLTSVLTASWLNFAKHLNNFYLIDVFFLLMILNSPVASNVTSAWSVLDSALERRAIAMPLIRIFVLDSSLLDSSAEDFSHQSVLFSIFEHLLLSKNPIMADFGADLGVLLFVCIPALRRQVADTLLYASSQFMSNLHTPLEDALGKIRKETRKQVSSVEGASAALPSAKPATSTAKSDANQGDSWSVMNWRYPLKSIMELCVCFGKDMIPFAQPIEDAMLRWTFHNGGIASVESMSPHQHQHWLAHIHAMAFSLAALVPLQSSLISSLFILFQKQTSSGHMISQICGIVLAQHLLQSAPLETQDRHFLVSHLLRILPSLPPRARLHLFHAFTESATNLEQVQQLQIQAIVIATLEKTGLLLSPTSPHPTGVILQSAPGFELNDVEEYLWDVCATSEWLTKCHDQEGFVYSLSLLKQLVQCHLALLSRLDPHDFHQWLRCPIRMPVNWGNPTAPPAHILLNATVAQLVVEACAEFIAQPPPARSAQTTRPPFSTDSQFTIFSSLSRFILYNDQERQSEIKPEHLQALLSRTNQASQLFGLRQFMRNAIASMNPVLVSSIKHMEHHHTAIYAPPHIVALKLLASPVDPNPALYGLYLSCTYSTLLSISTYLTLPSCSIATQAEWTLPAHRTVSIAAYEPSSEPSDDFSSTMLLLDLSYTKFSACDACSPGKSAFTLVANLLPASAVPIDFNRSSGVSMNYDSADPTRMLLREGCGTGATLFFRTLTSSGPLRLVLPHIVAFWRSISDPRDGVNPLHPNFTLAVDHVVVETLLRLSSFVHPVDSVTLSSSASPLSLQSATLMCKLMATLSVAWSDNGGHEREIVQNSVRHFTALFSALLRRSTDAASVTSALYILALLAPFEPSVDDAIRRELISHAKKPLQFPVNNPLHSTLASLIALLTSSIPHAGPFKPIYPDKPETNLATFTSLHLLHGRSEWLSQRQYYVEALAEFMMKHIATQQQPNGTQTAEETQAHPVYQSITIQTMPFLCFHLLRQVLGTINGLFDRKQKPTSLDAQWLSFTAPHSPLPPMVALVRQGTYLFRIFARILSQVSKDKAPSHALNANHFRRCISLFSGYLRLLPNVAVEWRIHTMSDDPQLAASNDIQANGTMDNHSTAPPARRQAVASVSVLSPIFCECWNAAIELQTFLTLVQDSTSEISKRFPFPVMVLLRGIELSLERIQGLSRRRHVSLDLDPEPSHQVWGDPAFWNHLICGTPLPEIAPIEPPRMDVDTADMNGARPENGFHGSILELYGMGIPETRPTLLNNFAAPGPVNVLVPRSKKPNSTQASAIVQNSHALRADAAQPTQALAARILQPYNADADEEWSFMAPNNGEAADLDDSMLDTSYEDPEEENEADEEAEEEEESWDSQDIEQDDLYMEHHGLSAAPSGSNPKKRSRSDDDADDDSEVSSESASKRRST